MSSQQAHGRRTRTKVDYIVSPDRDESGGLRSVSPNTSEEDQSRILRNINIKHYEQVNE